MRQPKEVRAYTKNQDIADGAETLEGGTFAPHSQLPSIRSIAADAGVNINTVKKAFSDLESYGAIYTVPGKGSFVSEKAFKNDSVHDTAVSEISDAISAARAKGLKKQEIIDILNEIYTQEEEL